MKLLDIVVGLTDFDKKSGIPKAALILGKQRAIFWINVNIFVVIKYMHRDCAKINKLKTVLKVFTAGIYARMGTEIKLKQRKIFTIFAGMAAGLLFRETYMNSK